MQVLSRNLLANFTTGSSRLLLARMPRGTQQIVVTPENTAYVRVGDADVAAAADVGHFCLGGQSTVIRAREGQRIAGIAAATAGAASIEIWGQSRGDMNVEKGRDKLSEIAPPFDFDFEHEAPHVNNSSAMFVAGYSSGYASQTTAANVPGDGAIKARQALAFDGTNDVLPVTGFLDLTNGVSSFLAAVAFQVAAAPAGDRALLTFSINGAATARFAIGLDASLGVYAAGRILDADTTGAVNSVGGAVKLDTPTVLIVRFDCAAATIDAWVNGKQALDGVAWPNVTAGAVSATNSQEVNIGAANLAATIGGAIAIADPAAAFDIARLNVALSELYGAALPAAA